MSIEDARRDLRLKINHAFGHSHPGGDHNHLNLEGFLRMLETFIEEKIDEDRRRRRR